MTFDFETAKKIRGHYRFLIGEPLSSNNPDIKVFDIIIAPTQKEQKDIFVSMYWRDKNNDAALLASGYNPKEVEVLLVSKLTTQPTYSFNKRNIDEYLTERGLEKVYLEEGY